MKLKSREEAKKNRVLNIERAINEISRLATDLAFKPAHEVRQAISALERRELTEADFHEFLPKAEEEKKKALFFLGQFAEQTEKLEQKKSAEAALKAAEQQLADAQLEKERALREKAESQLETIQVKQATANASASFNGSDKEKLQAYIAAVRKAATSKPDNLQGEAHELISWFEKNLDKLLNIAATKVEEL